MRAIAAVTVLVLALLAAGCGDSGPSDETAAETTAKAKKPAAKPLFEREMGPTGKEWLRAAKAAEKSKDPRWAELKKAAGSDAGQLVFPHGPPPEEVVFKDLRVGKGAALQPGDHFGANYTSFDYKTGVEGQKFSEGSAALYAYGEDELVDAWEPGLKGMRVGGIREIISPAPYSYGTPTVYLLELVTVEKLR